MFVVKEFVLNFQNAESSQVYQPFPEFLERNQNWNKEGNLLNMNIKNYNYFNRTYSSVLNAKGQSEKLVLNFLNASL